MSRRSRVLVAIAAVILAVLLARWILREPDTGLSLGSSTPPGLSTTNALAVVPQPEASPAVPVAPAAPKPSPAPPAAPAAEAVPQPEHLLTKEDKARRKAEAEAREAEVARVVGNATTACDFQETLFLDVVRHLSESHKVRIDVDSDLFPTVSDMKLTLNFKSAPLAKVLRTMGAMGGAIIEADGDGLRFRKEPDAPPAK